MNLFYQPTLILFSPTLLIIKYNNNKLIKIYKKQITLMNNFSFDFEYNN